MAYVKAMSCVVQIEVSLLSFPGQFYFCCYNECYPLQLLNLQCSEQGGGPSNTPLKALPVSMREGSVKWFYAQRRFFSKEGSEVNDMFSFTGAKKCNELKICREVANR